MFSLATLFRAAPRAIPARAFASSAISRAPPSAPVDDLISALDSTQENLEGEFIPTGEVSARWNPDNMRKIELFKPITPTFFTAKARLNKDWRKRRAYLGPGGPESRRQDIFHQLGIDPVKECLNGNLLSGYLSDMGRIQARAQTGLTWRSQRRLSKAIRRAKMIGVIPLHSRRPLLKGY